MRRGRAILGTFFLVVVGCADADVAPLGPDDDSGADGWSMVAIGRRGIESPAALDLLAPNGAWVPLGPTRARGYDDAFDGVLRIAAVSPDGSVAVVVSGGAVYAVHRADDGVAHRLMYPPAQTGEPQAFVIDPTSTFVAFRADETLYVAVLDGSQPAVAVATDEPFVTAEFSGDGAYLVIDAERPFAIPVAGGAARLLPFTGTVAGPYLVRHNGNRLSIFDLRSDAPPVEVDVGRHRLFGFVADTYAVLADSESGIARLALDGPADRALVPVVQLPDGSNDRVEVRHLHEDLVIFERFASDEFGRRALFAQPIHQTNAATLLVDREEAYHQVFGADDEAVYMCRGGRVERVLRDGGGAPSLILDTGGATCGDAGLTAGHVYVCSGGDCRGVEANGGEPFELGSSVFAVPYGFVALRDHSEAAVFVVDETLAPQRVRPWGPPTYSTRIERDWLFVFDAEGTHAAPLDGSRPLRRIGTKWVTLVWGERAFAASDDVVWAQRLDGGNADAPDRIDPGVRVLELHGVHDGRLVIRTDDGFALVGDDGAMERLPSSNGGAVAVDERRGRVVWASGEGLFKYEAGRTERIADVAWGPAPPPLLDDTGRYAVIGMEWRSTAFDLDAAAHPRVELPGAPIGVDGEGRVGTKNGAAVLSDGVELLQANLQGGAATSLVASFQQVVFDASGPRGVAIDGLGALVYFGVGEAPRPFDVRALSSSSELSLVGRHAYYLDADAASVNVVDIDDGSVTALFAPRSLRAFEALPTSGFVFQTTAAPHRIELGEGAERREVLVEIDEGELWVDTIVAR